MSTRDSQALIRREGSAEQLTDMVEFERALDPPEIHSYPLDPRYRRSGVLTCPQPGDLALCGHVKIKPGHPTNNKKPVTCTQCARLKAVHGYA